MLTVLSHIFIMVKQNQLAKNMLANLKIINHLYIFYFLQQSQKKIFLISVELFKVEVLDLHFYHFKLFPF